MTGTTRGGLSPGLPGEYIHWAVSAEKFKRISPIGWLNHVESLPCLRRSQLAKAIANLQ